MKIEHAALYVSDLAGARDFFVRCLGAASNEGYHNPKTGFRSYFLRFEDGARLELMQAPGALSCPGYGHLAFCLGSRAAVDELTARLRSDGYPVVSGPRVTGDGYYESCIEVFDGYRIELTAGEMKV